MTGQGMKALDEWGTKCNLNPKSAEDRQPDTAVPRYGSGVGRMQILGDNLSNNTARSSL